MFIPSRVTYFALAYWLFASLSPQLAKAAQMTVLHSFGSGEDGAEPMGGLTDVGGTLYGTTSEGGANGAGTVFQLTRSGKEEVVYSFRAGSDGDAPNADLSDVDGVLYGITTFGGLYDAGTVFKVSTNGGEKVLHSFGSGKDGARPNASLIQLEGSLYGTTTDGGAYGGPNTGGGGTVFRITPAGAEKVLHSFGGAEDGKQPASGLIRVGGTLYGTTISGNGSSIGGTIFSISTAGIEKVVHSFRRSEGGENPEANLIDVNGTLYGTTMEGGSDNAGTVFQMTAGGAERILYSFGAKSGLKDGANPRSGLTTIDGLLYGTAPYGGAYGEGTLFEVSAAGAFKVLHTFGSGKLGGQPFSGLINVGGILYGTTAKGGAYGKGTVFKITP
jgi:uncharacterized repeat protein (TIGR03803 family)